MCINSSSYHTLNLFIQVEQIDANNLYFLASLPEEEYEVLQSIFEKYEMCDLKGQKLSRSQKGTNSSTLDCKPSNFKCLRGLEDATRLSLLKQVSEGELSFRELVSFCQYAKKMSEVQKRFLMYHSLTSWEDAKKTFPHHATQQALEPFVAMNFSKGTIHLFNSASLLLTRIQTTTFPKAYRLQFQQPKTMLPVFSWITAALITVQMECYLSYQQNFRDFPSQSCILYR